MRANISLSNNMVSENLMKVANHDTGIVCYDIPELGIQRQFNVGEVKEIDEKELEALYQVEGGANMLQNRLCVQDRKWVEKHWDAPLEYFWTIAEVKKCLLEDSIELFNETMEYAPECIVETMKDLAWRLPISDLNKIQSIFERTGFDVQQAIKMMKDAPAVEKPAGRQRLRREGA